jgi:HSP20 family protein
MAEQSTMPMKKEDTAPRRWDPLEMFDTLQEEMDRFWRRPGPFWSGALPTLLRRAGGRGLAWAPRMDVYEKDNQLIVEAELPGINKEDVQVELEGGNLVIHGESRQEREIRDEEYYRTERSYGSFHRRLPLPFDVNPDQIQATMNNGVLEVRIPKPAEARTETQRIQVK